MSFCAGAVKDRSKYLSDPNRGKSTAHTAQKRMWAGFFRRLESLLPIVENHTFTLVRDRVADRVLAVPVQPAGSEKVEQS